jgi:Double zinc ribbon
MRCPQCGFENRDGVRFCEECGGKLEVTCSACGAAVPPGRKFCGHCGQSLSTQTTARFQSPGSYTPKHLAEKILTSKSALEGERKQVTVLFADLKGPCKRSPTSGSSTTSSRGPAVKRIGSFMTSSCRSSDHRPRGAPGSPGVHPGDEPRPRPT